MLTPLQQADEPSTVPLDIRNWLTIRTLLRPSEVIDLAFILLIILNIHVFHPRAVNQTCSQEANFHVNWDL